MEVINMGSSRFEWKRLTTTTTTTMTLIEVVPPYRTEWNATCTTRERKILRAKESEVRERGCVITVWLVWYSQYLIQCIYNDDDWLLLSIRLIYSIVIHMEWFQLKCDLSFPLLLFYCYCTLLYTCHCNDDDDNNNNNKRHHRQHRCRTQMTFDMNK